MKKSRVAVAPQSVSIGVLRALDVTGLARARVVSEGGTVPGAVRDAVAIRGDWQRVGGDIASAARSLENGE